MVGWPVTYIYDLQLRFFLSLTAARMCLSFWVVVLFDIFSISEGMALVTLSCINAPVPVDMLNSVERATTDAVIHKYAFT